MTSAGQTGMKGELTYAGKTYEFELSEIRTNRNVAPKRTNNDGRRAKSRKTT